MKRVLIPTIAVVQAPNANRRSVGCGLFEAR